MTLFEDVVKHGLQYDHHESDLYVMVTGISGLLLRKHGHPNPERFKDKSGNLWYEIPFAYDPFWKQKGMKRPNPAKSVANLTSARELLLYIEDSGDLYRQKFIPIRDNLMKKIAKRTFDLQKSVKLWMYLVDEGAKRYNKEMGEGKLSIPDYFNKATRRVVAEELAKAFVEDVKTGNYV